MMVYTQLLHESLATYARNFCDADVFVNSKKRNILCIFKERNIHRSPSAKRESKILNG